MSPQLTTSGQSLYLPFLTLTDLCSDLGRARFSQGRALAPACSRELPESAKLLLTMVL